MAVNMKGKNLLSMGDLSLEEFEQIMKTTEMLKIQRQVGQPHPLLVGKTLAMIFEKPSTRTRVSFEAGMLQLGGHALYLSSHDLQLRRGETISDTARVLSRYVDVVMARVFKHDTVVDLARYCSVPVINGLSDLEHPCQVLGDFFTILEKKRKLSSLKIAYVGDGNNVCHSLLLGAALVGMNIYTAHPEGYFPDEDVVRKARSLAERWNCIVDIGSDPLLAVRDADVLYTDVWTSMGQEDEKKIRENLFRDYRLDEHTVSYARDDCIILHCLPAHRGQEITDEVMDGPNSVVFDEAENRLHVQKAILALLVG